MRAEITGAILAGGGARRLIGAAKGLIRFGGDRAIDRVAAALRGVTDRIFVVSSAAGARKWLPGCEVIADEHAGWGPMGGIASALRATGCDVLAVAWDMPFVTASMLRALIVEETSHDCVAWRSEAGVEPLVALYRLSALPAIDAALARGERRAREVASLLRLRTIGDLPADCGPDSLRSINTPDDVDRAHRYADGALPAPGTK
jgi:molybdopterin-guanine dinucleotide biosynthesis protein A